MIYLCATPIGNLEDITLRVVRILREADVIYAEDTRHTLQLLNHLGIKKPLVSCHEHNEQQRAQDIIADSRAGRMVAVVSDAGMPGISDPGGAVARAAAQAGEPFTVKGLYKLLEGRKETLPEGSYTTYLFQKGLDKILKKVGEESTEVIVAAKGGDKAETIYEIADLMYHVMVLMVEMGISVEDVYKELASRHIIDHKVKQEKMTP